MNDSSTGTAAAQVAVETAPARFTRDRARTGLFRFAAAFGLVGALLPHRQIAALVHSAGGSADLELGFLFLKFVLVCTGGLLGLAAWFNAGWRNVPVMRTGATGVPFERADVRTVVGLSLLAVVLRLPALGVDLWLDEMLTLVDFIRAPLVTLLTSFESQNNHPLYSLLGKTAVALFGESPASLRLPAVLFGGASIGAMYWFGTVVTTRREALLGAGVLTVSYHHVWFSQNARAYTALLFFALIGTGLFVRMCAARAEEDARRMMWLYAGTMTLAVYAHLTAALVVLGHCLVWAFEIAAGRHWRDAWRAPPLLAMALAGFFSLALYAPGLGHIAAGLGGAGEQVHMVWKNPIWMLAEVVRGLARGVPGGIPVLVIAALAAGAGVASYLVRDRVTLLLMVMPGVLTAGVLVASGHNLWPRFFFFAAGFAVLIVIRGIVALAALQRLMAPQLLGTAVAVLLMVGSAATVPAAWAPKQDFAAARDFIESARAPADLVAVTGVTEWVYHEYIETDWTPVETASALREMMDRPGRTWVVYAMPELIEARTPELWRTIQTGTRRVGAFEGTLAGGAVYVSVSR